MSFSGGQTIVGDEIPPNERSELSGGSCGGGILDCRLIRNDTEIYDSDTISL
jgi:hypothetical protein